MHYQLARNKHGVLYIFGLPSALRYQNDDVPTYRFHFIFHLCCKINVRTIVIIITIYDFIFICTRVCLDKTKQATVVVACVLGWFREQEGVSNQTITKEFNCTFCVCCRFFFCLYNNIIFVINVY